MARCLAEYFNSAGKLRSDPNPSPLRPTFLVPFLCSVACRENCDYSRYKSTHLPSFADWKADGLLVAVIHDDLSAIFTDIAGGLFWRNEPGKPWSPIAIRIFCLTRSVSGIATIKEVRLMLDPKSQKIQMAFLRVDNYLEDVPSSF